MPFASHPEDLTLHGVRVLGFATAARIAGRYGLEPAQVDETLLDLEVLGLVRRQNVRGDRAWSLTEAGRADDTRRMAAELAAAGDGAAVAVRSVHRMFVPVNERFGQACTDWQLRPSRVDPLDVNDHTDPRWDDRVLDRLASLGSALGVFCDELAASLIRFGAYGALYSAALRHVEAGRHSWVDAPDRDSLQLVWMQFHEDLIATLGIERGAEV